MAKYGKSKEERLMYEPKYTCSIEEWKNWSQTPHTPEEIRHKLLTDFDNVCFSFVCAHSKLPEEFIPEFMALSTGLLNCHNYDKYIENVKKAVLMNAGIIEKDDKIMKWGIPFPYQNSRGEIVCKTITGAEMKDRMDWYAITVHQKLTENFMREYQAVLRWDILPHYQRVTTGLYVEMHDKISMKVIVRATKAERDDMSERDITDYFKNLRQTS